MLYVMLRINADLVVNAKSPGYVNFIVVRIMPHSYNEQYIIHVIYDSVLNPKTKYKGSLMW